MRGAAGLGLAILAGCSQQPPPESSLERAERRYDFVYARNGSASDLCPLARAGRDAAIDEAKETGYLLWQSRVSLHCDAGIR
jgi:hypothetical protein